MPMKKSCSRVIWITGLSGAGKSTLACELATRFRADSIPTVLLDGDELRSIFDVEVPIDRSYSYEARLALAMRYSKLCLSIASQGFTVVIATISLFREVHKWNRENLPGYFEVFLRVPLEELRRRDPKGIYSRFDSGELSNVAGLDLPVDEPAAPDWIVQYVPNRPVKRIADELLSML